MTEEKEVATEQNGQEKKEDNTENGDKEESIIRQVEYYFSDVNLPRDKFLREQVKLDDGWVPLDILTRFNRLAKITTDIDVIATALNNSTSGLLEVSEDNKKVRRNPELPVPEMNEERRKEVMGRTVYAKGFPKAALLDDLLNFFKQYEEVENVIMRRYQDRATKKRHFKGSVFATFKTKEQAEKFMNTKDMKYQEVDLLLHWQENYLQMKQEEYASRKDKRDKKKEEKPPVENDFKLPSGTVLHFTQTHDTLKREDVRDALAALDTRIPLKKTIQERPPLPWWDSECMEAVTRRKDAEKQYKKAMTEENFLQYKQIAGHTKRLLAKKKKAWKKIMSSNT